MGYSPWGRTESDTTEHRPGVTSEEKSNCPAPAERLLWPWRASPSASQLLAFSPGKEQAAECGRRACEIGISFSVLGAAYAL